MPESAYLPGVCNIGSAEIARRRRAGWIGLAGTMILLVVLIALDAGRWWGLLLFLPATMSASGFLQAHFRFCAGFSRAGVFNFGPTGETQKVNEEESLAADRKRGNQITLYAVLIGAAVSVVAVALG
jgi:hypothetical protein